MKHYTLAQEQIKEFEKKQTQDKIEKIVVYGIILGWMASMLYLMFILTATLTA